MSFQSRKLSQKSLFASRASTKWPPRPNFNGSYLANDMEYDLAFLYVFIWATFNHSDEVSSKSEGVTWELFWKLVDLTRNDPFKDGMSCQTLLKMAWGETMAHFPDHITRYKTCNSWHSGLPQNKEMLLTIKIIIINRVGGLSFRSKPDLLQRHNNNNRC